MKNITKLMAVFFLTGTLLSNAFAAEHRLCTDSQTSQQAMLVFFSDASHFTQGGALVMLSDKGSFGDTTDSDARVFSKISALEDGSILVTSRDQPETLMVTDDLQTLIVYGKKGCRATVLTCQ